jgi:hypothetical protein
MVEAVWWLFILVFVMAVTYGLTGCASTTTVKPVIEISRPVLPEVKSAELECVSLDAYVRLRERDLLLHQFADELTLIVCEIAECPK